MPKDQLKLTPLALDYLKDVAGIDLFKGAKLEFEPKTLARLYSAATQHWEKPVEYEDAMESDVIELMEALNPILARLQDSMKGSSPAKKKPRRVKTGG